MVTESGAAAAAAETLSISMEEYPALMRLVSCVIERSREMQAKKEEEADEMEAKKEEEADESEGEHSQKSAFH